MRNLTSSNTNGICVCFQSYGNSQREYEKAVTNFSVKNQLRHKGNLGKKNINKN